jgi:hypothetical protein
MSGKSAQLVELIDQPAAQSIMHLGTPELPERILSFGTICSLGCSRSPGGGEDEVG